jgi:hypothetical protein
MALNFSNVYMREHEQEEDGSFMVFCLQPYKHSFKLIPCNHHYEYERQGIKMELGRFARKKEITQARPSFLIMGPLDVDPPVP